MANDRLVNIQEQEGESENAANDALSRLSEMSKRVRLLEGKVLGLKSRLSKIGKARYVAVSGSDGPLREIQAFEARTRMLCNKLDLH